MEQETKVYTTIISKKLHDILKERGIHPVKTEINRANPVLLVWKYVPSEELEKIREEYVALAHKKIK